MIGGVEGGESQQQQQYNMQQQQQQYGSVNQHNLTTYKVNKMSFNDL